MAPQRRKRASTRAKTNPFRVKWKIVSTDVWEPASLDEFEPAHLTFESDGKGELAFIAITASGDHRLGTRDGSPIIEFTWAGDDDGSPISGRGWAQSGPRGLVGRMFIHDGDEAHFAAERFAKTERTS